MLVGTIVALTDTVAPLRQIVALQSIGTAHQAWTLSLAIELVECIGTIGNLVAALLVRIVASRTHLAAFGQARGTATLTVDLIGMIATIRATVADELGTDASVRERTIQIIGMALLTAELIESIGTMKDAVALLTFAE